MNERTHATQALIRRLATEAADTPRWQSRALPLAMTIAALLAFGSVLALMGVRGDLAAALGGIGGQKVLAGAVMALAAAVCCREAARPDARTWPRAFLFLGLLAFAVPALQGEAALPTWHMLVADPAGPVCFTTILAIAVAPLIVLMAGLRRTAPGRPRLAGLAAGAMAAGLASCAYALHCTADTVTVASFWYPASVVAAAAAGGLLGRRCLAW